MRGVGLPDPPDLRATIRLRKPSQVAVSTTDQQGTTQSVADGTHLFLVSPSDKDQYLKVAVSPGEQTIRKALIQGRATGTGALLLLLTGEDPLAPLAASLRSLSVDKKFGSVDGVPVVTVTATFSGPRVGDEGSVTFAIGKADHLLRQVTLVRTVGGQTFSVTETHTNVHANPEIPARVFVFTPPAGARKVASLSLQQPPTGDASPPPPPPAASGRRGRGTLAASEPAVSSVETAAAGRPEMPVPHSPPPTSAPSNLAVVATPGVAVTAPNQGRFNFGQVSLLDQPRLEKTFTLRNHGNAPVALQRLSSNCGCIGTVVTTPGSLAPGRERGREAEPAATAPLPTLAPGQKTYVRVSVDLAQIPPGAVNKSVSVYAEGESIPVARLEVAGTLSPLVTFSPALLDLGPITAGQEHSRTFTATFDARLLQHGSAPPFALASRNPAIRLRPLPEPTPTSERASAKEMLTRTYTLTVLPDAPIGPLQNQVVMKTTPSGSSALAKPTVPSAPSVPSNASLLIVGQVLGEVSAQPQAVALGLTTPGKATTREVVLVAKNAALLENLRAEAASALIDVHQKTDDTSGDGEARSKERLTRTLEVTLKPGAPAGVLQSNLIVTLASGRRLVIPVNGYVQGQVGRQ